MAKHGGGFRHRVEYGCAQAAGGAGDTADTPRYIETIPRRGYWFIGTVHGEEPPAPQPTDAAATFATSTVPPPATVGGRAPDRRGFFFKVGIPTLVALTLVAALLYSGAFRTTGPASAFSPPPHSVAVLPFVNMSGDPTQEYFSDGLSEELLNALSRIDDLQVAAQTSSFHFKGNATDLPTIAHKLNVATILEGSVRKSGHTIRITAQLVNATTGYHVWSETYDRNVDDALTLQSDIANAVAGALEITLLNNAAVKADLGGTRNPQALDAYLRGLKFAAATLRSGEEARQTIAAFTAAINLDPNFALAYTARARALVEYG